MSASTKSVRLDVELDPQHGMIEPFGGFPVDSDPIDNTGRSPVREDCVNPRRPSPIGALADTSLGIGISRTEYPVIRKSIEQHPTGNGRANSRGLLRISVKVANQDIGGAPERRRPERGSGKKPFVGVACTHWSARQRCRKDW